MINYLPCVLFVKAKNEQVDEWMNTSIIQNKYNSISIELICKTYGWEKNSTEQQLKNVVAVNIIWDYFSAGQSLWINTAGWLAQISHQLLKHNDLQV